MAHDAPVARHLSRGEAESVMAHIREIYRGTLAAAHRTQRASQMASIRTRRASQVKSIRRFVRWSATGRAADRVARSGDASVPTPLADGFVRKDVT